MRERMIPLIGLLIAALLMATGNLLENNALFLAGSVLLLICSLLYFQRR